MAPKHTKTERAEISGLLKVYNKKVLQIHPPDLYLFIYILIKQSKTNTILVFPALLNIRAKKVNEFAQRAVLKQA